MVWCSIRQHEEQRREAARAQHARSFARGQAAAHRDRLRAQVEQTEAKLVAAEQAQRAKRAQALKTVQRTQLDLR